MVLENISHALGDLISLLRKFYAFVTGQTKNNEPTESTETIQKDSQSSDTTNTQSIGNVSDITESEDTESNRELADEAWQRLHDQSIDYSSERY